MPVPATAGALDQLIAFTGRDPLQMNHHERASDRGLAMTSANTNCRVLDVDGGRLYADTRSGTAPALVFLHHWGVRGVPGSRCSIV